jgi:hypothetical protein
MLEAIKFGYPSVDRPQAVVLLSALAGKGSPRPAATESPSAAYAPPDELAGGSAEAVVAGGSDEVVVAGAVLDVEL